MSCWGANEAKEVVLLDAFLLDATGTGGLDAWTKDP